MDPNLQLLRLIMQQQSYNSHANSNCCCPYHPPGNVVQPEPSQPTRAQQQPKTFSKYAVVKNPLKSLETFTVTFTEGEPLGLLVQTYCEETGQDAVVTGCYTPFATNHVITPSIVLSINGEMVYRRQHHEILDMLRHSTEYGPATIIFSPLFVGHDHMHNYNHQTGAQEAKSSITNDNKENVNEFDHECDIKNDIDTCTNTNPTQIVKKKKKKRKRKKKKKKNKKEKEPILPGGVPLMKEYEFDFDQNFEIICKRYAFDKRCLCTILSSTLSTGTQRFISKNQRETYLNPWTIYTNVGDTVVFDVGVCLTGRAVTICPRVLHGKSPISYSEAIEKAHNALEHGILTQMGKGRHKRYIYALDDELLKFGANGLTLLNISPQQQQ